MAGDPMRSDLVGKNGTETGAFNGTGSKEHVVKALMESLRLFPFLERRKGVDHFFVLSHPSRGFMYDASGSDLPPAFHTFLRNMVKLSPERGLQAPPNDVALPYPTAFHPASQEELESQQEWLGQTVQRDIFAALAASPKNSHRAQTRTFLMRQCGASGVCALLNCVSKKSDVDSEGFGPNRLNSYNQCNKPDVLLNLLHRAQFCLIPPGDRYARRATFDAMLAGCIPVFFHNATARLQYMWHLPKTDKWSISISDKALGRGSVMKILSRVSRKRKRALRENLQKYLLRIVYANPGRKYYAESILSVGRRRLLADKEGRNLKNRKHKQRERSLKRKRVAKAKNYVPSKDVLEGNDAFDLALKAVLKIVQGAPSSLWEAAPARPKVNLTNEINFDSFPGDNSDSSDEESLELPEDNPLESSNFTLLERQQVNALKSLQSSFVVSSGNNSLLEPSKNNSYDVSEDNSVNNSNLTLESSDIITSESSQISDVQSSQSSLKSSENEVLESSEIVPLISL